MGHFAGLIPFLLFFVLCPGEFYCPAASQTPTPCPPDFYCPLVQIILNNVPFHFMSIGIGIVIVIVIGIDIGVHVCLSLFCLVFV